MLGNLYPLLRQSLAWFRSVREVLRGESMGSKVRSSDLETGLSSSAETDIATPVPSSIPSSSRPFFLATPRALHTLKKECSLKIDTFNRFRDRFQFPAETRVCLPGREKSPVLSLMVRFVVMRLRSCVVSDFLSTHL